MAGSDPLRVAVVGVAGIGRTHLAAFRALAESGLCRIAAVCDVNLEALEKARAEFGVERAFGEYEALLDDPVVDVVSLCVPHFLHRQMALEAIAAGKHLLLEKPVGMTYGEAMEIAAAAATSAGITGVVFQSRFDPQLRFVRDEVVPRLGVIRFASSREYHWRGSAYYSGAAWRGTWWGEGGGLFINQCIHGWDVMQWLLGGVDFAYGYWTNLLHPRIEVEDIGYGFVRFRGPDGRVVPGRTVATTCLSNPALTEATPWNRRVSIHVKGERGEVIANDFRAPRQGQPMADFRFYDEALDRELHAAMEAAVATAGNQAANHETNLRAYLEAVRDGEAPPVMVESAAEIQRIIDGIHWHGWRHAAAFREWAASITPLPADADAAKGGEGRPPWDGGAMWRQLLEIVETEAPVLEAPFVAT